MSIKSTLLKAGAVYVVGRLLNEVSLDDVRRWSRAVKGLSREDLRKMAFELSEDALHRVGLQRRRSIFVDATLVASGVAVGAAVGAGVVYVLTSEQGKKLRQKVMDSVRGKKTTNGASQTADVSASAAS